MRTIKQQVADALWYLNKPGQSQLDEEKAIEILSHIAFGEKAKSKLTQIQDAFAPVLEGNLTGKFIALIPGHEPGGGAEGERDYNIKVANQMKRILEAQGAHVIIYLHTIKAYSKRQDAMAKAIKKLQPKNDICIELHYDAVARKSASGHHFQYYSSKGEVLAQFFRNEWQRMYPQSKTHRGSTGIYENKRGNGAGFLHKSPGVAVLTEPFFRSNDAEWDFYKNRHREVAEVYCQAIINYFN